MEHYQISSLQIVSFLIVGALWGCSNALLKYETAKNKRKRRDNSVNTNASIWSGIKLLLSTEAALIYLVNQSGSLIYYYLLGSYDISLAVPICNSLTLVFTAITSYFLGEVLRHPFRVAFGSFCVILGVGLCVTAK